MEHVIVRYRLDPARRAEHEGLIRGVYAQLERDTPAGLRYRTLRLEDGVSYVHLADLAPGSSVLSDVAAFRAFRDGLDDRCAEGPVRVTAAVLGAYGQPA